MAFFFQNIDIFFITVLVVTALCCIKISTPDSFVIAIILSFLYCAGQIQTIWTSPESMIYLHGGIVLIMAGTLRSSISKPLILLALAMIITDCVWIVLPLMDLPQNRFEFPGNIFWCQSVLNLLLLAMLIFTLKGCYDAHKVSRYRRRVKRDSFFAFDSLQSKDMAS